MTAFRWNPQFATGNEVIDAQHHHLVDLIGGLSDHLEHVADVDGGVLAAIYAELVEYSRYHFRTEEDLMREVGVDLRHVEGHRREHEDFVNQVVAMVGGPHSEGRAAPHRLLEFLVHWLTYHILGRDHSLARQVRAVREGRPAADAYADSERAVDTATATLLTSVRQLFDALSERNQELTELATSLERRVAERTEALAAANAELQVVLARVETMAMTDILTDLPNRRHALDALAREWAASVRSGRPLSCLVVDADGFKEVNDVHGHEAGDVVLKAVAAALRGAVRAADVVCRVGGDEFLVIAPDTPLAGALRVGERLRAAIASLRVAVGEGGWRGSISVGVAERDGSTPDVEALLRAADRGVYEAKRAGRNAVRAAEAERAPGPIAPPDSRRAAH